MPVRKHPYSSDKNRVPAFNDRFASWYGSMSRTRRVGAVSVLVICLVTALALSLSDSLRRLTVGAVRPFAEAGAKLRLTVESMANSMRPLSAVERDMMDDLRDEIRLLKIRVTTSEEAVAENMQLRSLLRLESPSGWREIVAPVILREPVSWDRRMRIGRGSEHGVVPGAIALAGTNVVGRITEVGRRTSVLATVLDAECRLSVQLLDSGTVGIIHGGGGAGAHAVSRLAAVSFLPKNGVYREGETVLTSGLSGFVPGGFLVGFVSADEHGQVSNIVDESYASVNVRPAADLDSCRFVAVLVPVSESVSAPDASLNKDVQKMRVR